jgi:hypothetical protein
MGSGLRTVHSTNGTNGGRRLIRIALPKRSRALLCVERKGHVEKVRAMRTSTSVEVEDFWSGTDPRSSMQGRDWHSHSAERA